MSHATRAAALTMLLGSLAPAHAKETWVSLDPNAGPGTPPTVAINYDSSNKNDTQFDVTIHGFWQEGILGPDGVSYKRVRVPGIGHVGQIGAPDLPALRVNLAVVTKREDLILNSVTVLAQKKIKNYTPYPLGKTGFDEEIDPNRDPGEGDTDGSAETFEKDATIYTGSAIWPPIDGLGGPIKPMMSGVPGGTCTIYPFDWNPNTNQMTVATSLRCQVQHNGSPLYTASLNPSDHKLVQKFFLNAVAVGSDVLVNLNEHQARYLIITPPMYMDTLKPFITLKKAQGFQVLTTQLTGNETWLNILAYVKTWYEQTSKGVSHYCLLVGDTDWIPLGYSTLGSSSTDDLYGSPHDLDLFEEVYVGRLSVDNAGDLGSQLFKIINYTTKPVAGGRYDRALLVAHKEGGLDKYIGAHEDVRLKIYTNPPAFLTRYGNVENGNNGVLQDIQNELGLVAYRGHGSTMTWSKWNIPELSLHKNDIVGLANAVQPVIWSISCTNHNLATNGGGLTDCIGEVWLEDGSGAIASYGATRTTGTTANHELDRRLFEAVYDLGITTHAHAIAYAEAMMVAAYPDTINAWAYNLLGDPSMKIRTEVPININASIIGNDLIKGTGIQKLTIKATTDTGAALAQAQVSLFKEGAFGGDEILMNGYTNGSGFITFHVDPKTLGDIHYTVQQEDGNLVYATIPVYDAAGCELAKNETYGEGTPGTNGVPLLEALDLPTIGQLSGIRIANALPGALSYLVLGATPASIPFDEGTLLVTPQILIPIPVPIGADGTLPIHGTIPFNPAFCGVDLYHQAWIVDPAADGFYHLALTAGLKRTFGG